MEDEDQNIDRQLHEDAADDVRLNNRGVPTSILILIFETCCFSGGKRFLQNNI